MFNARLSYAEIISALSHVNAQDRLLTWQEMEFLGSSLQQPFVKEALSLYPLDKNLFELVNKSLFDLRVQYPHLSLSMERFHDLDGGKRPSVKKYFLTQHVPQGPHDKNTLENFILITILEHPLAKKALLKAQRQRSQKGNATLPHNKELEIDLIANDLCKYCAFLEEEAVNDPVKKGTLSLVDAIIRYIGTLPAQEQQNEALEFLKIFDKARTLYAGQEFKYASGTDFACLYGLEDLLLEHYANLSHQELKRSPTASTILSLTDPFVSTNISGHRRPSEALYELYLSHAGYQLQQYRLERPQLQEHINIDTLKEQYLQFYEGSKQSILRREGDLFDAAIELLQSDEAVLDKTYDTVVSFLKNAHALKTFETRLIPPKTPKTESEIMHSLIESGPFIDMGHLKMVLSLHDPKGSLHTMAQKARRGIVPQNDIEIAPKEYFESCYNEFLNGTSHPIFYPFFNERLIEALSQADHLLFQYPFSEIAICQLLEQQLILPDFQYRVLAANCAALGYTKAMKQLCAIINVNDDYLGSKLIHIATEKGHDDLVNMLIETGADCNAQDYLGLTPLMMAAQKNHLAIGELLIARGANMTPQSNIGAQAKYYAESENHEFFTFLLEENVITKNQALIKLEQLIAAQSEQGMSLSVLSRCGCDLSYISENQSALDFALRTHNEGLVKEILLQNSLPPYLIFRAIKSCVENVEHRAFLPLLLSKKDILLKFLQHNPQPHPVAWAARHHCPELVGFFMAHGRPLDRDFEGKTALDYAYELNSEPLLDIIKQFAPESVLLSPNLTQEERATPMPPSEHDSTQQDHQSPEPIPTAPQERPASPLLFKDNNQPMAEPKSPQSLFSSQELRPHLNDYAEANYEQDLLILNPSYPHFHDNLLSEKPFLASSGMRQWVENNRAALEKRSEVPKSYLLYKAIEHRHNDSIELLLELGANPNVAMEKPMESSGKEVDFSGECPRYDYHQKVTALMHAAERGQPSTINALAHFGANLNFQDYGQSALEMTISQNNVKNFDALIAAGADPNITLVTPYVPGVTLAERMRQNRHLERLLALIADSAADDLLSQARHSEDFQKRTTPLLTAIEHNRELMVETLLLTGANVNTPNQLGVTPLIAACVMGNKKIVQMLLEAQAAVNFRRSDGIPDDTALHTAAQRGYTEIVQSLIRYGAIINAPNSTYCSALSLAAQSGHLDTVRVLIKAGANIDWQNVDGVTPLMLAALYGHQHVVNELLGVAANFNLVDANGQSVLDYAQRFGHEELVKILKKHSPVQPEPFTPTPDRRALAELRTEPLVVIDRSLWGGPKWAGVLSSDASMQSWLNAHINRCNTLIKNQLFYLAVTHGFTQSAYALLVAGADPNVVEVDNGCGPFCSLKDSALMAASARASESTVRLLIQAGANVNFQSSGHNALTRACEIGYNTDLTHPIAITRMLLAAGANPEMALLVPHSGLLNALAPLPSLVLNPAVSKDLVAESRGDKILLLEKYIKKHYYKKNPLHRAAAEGFCDGVALMIEAGAAVNSYTESHPKTPLLHAVERRQYDVAELLLKHEADPNLDEIINGNTTPLHLAASQGRLDLVKALIGHKANVNACDIANETPLHKAAYSGHQHVMDYLIAHGALEIRNNKGQTPSELAAQVRASNLRSHQNFKRLMKNNPSPSL